MLFLDTIWRDVIYSLRGLRKNLGFTVTAVLTLALGIGGNTASFSIIRGVLLRPLEYREPDRLVYFSIENPKRGLQNSSFSQAQMDEMKGAKSFAGMGAYGRPESLGIAGGGEPEELKAARVSANFLDVLDVRPEIGRSFLPEEDRSGGRAVAMISDRLWKRRFQSDPAIAGRGVTIESTAYTIIGVLPDGFEFPYEGVDVWVTRPSEWSMLPPRYWGVPTLTGFGRLKQGVSLEQASAELTVAERQWDRAHPSSVNSDLSSAIRVERLQDRLVAGLRPMLWTLFGAVGFVLSIACANVAGLLLARGSARSREFTVRAALGAGRARLMGQLLTESMVIAVLGGALGVLIAEWALRGASHVAALAVPGAGGIRIDGMVLGFTIAISIAAGFLFGLLPGLEMSRVEFNRGLRDRTARGQRLRSVLVVGQVALSMVLLIGAALLIESFYRLRSVDPGFQQQNLLTARIVLPRARYGSDQQKQGFYGALEERLGRAFDGAAITSLLPTTAWIRTNVSEIETRGALDEKDPNSYAVVESATPGYFQTLGIRLKRGREFTDRDNTIDSPPVVMINETLERRLWPNGANPVGMHIKEGYDKALGWMEVVGVTSDIHEGGLESNPVSEIYLPLAKHPTQVAFVIARTRENPMRLANVLRDEVRAVDPDQAVSNVRTMETVFEAGFGQRQLMMILLAAFAAFAMFLAAVGIYGVIAYSVAQRTQEVGIRRALGAEEADILRMILARGVTLVLVGIAIGIAGAFAVTRVMNAWLFHVSATDPVTFVGIAILFTMVALGASYVPARRAASIDPAAALRDF